MRDTFQTNTPKIGVKGVAKRLFRDAKPLRGPIALGFVFSAILVACAAITPKLLGRIVGVMQSFWEGSFVSENGATLVQTILPLCLILVAVYLIKSGTDYARMWTLNNSCSRHYTAVFRIRMSKKILKLPIRFADSTPVGQLLERMTDDVSELSGAVFNIIVTFFGGILQMIVSIVLMVTEDWRMALLVVVLVPISLLISMRLSKKSEKYFDSMFEEVGHYKAAVEESYGNYQAIKAYNYEANRFEQQKTINERMRKAQNKGVFLSSIVTPIIALVNSLIYVVICAVGGYLIVRQGLSVGAVVTVIFFVNQFASPLEEIAMGVSEMQRMRASAERVYEMLELDEEEQGEGGTDELFERPFDGAEIQFENVDFSYKPEKPLIQDLNIEVREGQKIAIVGPTGAGKTTIVNLLMRFFDLDNGRILIRGRDIAGLNRTEVRSLFGMVLQDTWLFNGTVAENIAYGKPDATREEIVKAADKAFCDHFIRTLPDGYDSVIGEDKLTLSGGQKQLLTIARALLADRRYLILDEATSNVDTRTELLIQKAMNRLMKGRTCFVIAHRLSTIIDADLILVMNHGQIVETGTHKELLEKKGFYYELYTSQYRPG